jgi:hypothetical protein
METLSDVPRVTDLRDILLSEDFSTATEASSPSCQDTVLTYGSALRAKFYTRHQVLIRRRGK